jgi:hypothetical protein
LPVIIGHDLKYKAFKKVGLYSVQCCSCSSDEIFLKNTLNVDFAESKWF